LNVLGSCLGILGRFAFVQPKLLPAWSCLLLAVVVGFGLSLAIELTQVWLPGRDSSLSDLIANTVGTAIGGVLGIKGWRVIELLSY